MARPKAIKPLSDNLAFINKLVYGWPGIGKSVLAGTSPKALVLEGGTGETHSLLGQGLNVDVWQIHTQGDFEEAFEYMRHEGCDEYSWLWLDSASMTEVRLMKDYMVDALARNSSRSKFVPDKREYQLVQNTLDYYIREFVDLPIHFGVTAHVQIETITKLDEEGNEEEELMYMPQIQGGHGKLAQKICGYMNIVAFMDTVDIKGRPVRQILVQADATHVAKDRFDSVGDSTGHMLNPTIPKIMEACGFGESGGRRVKSSRPGKSSRATKATKATAKKVTKATKTTTAAKKARIR